MQRNIDRWRKEADILKEFISGKLKKRSSVSFAQTVMKRYRVNGDKDSINKAIFILKNKISAVAIKLRRYVTQEKSKKQNETFKKDRKQFYRDIEPNEKNNIPSPPSESDLREFWGNKIFGVSDLYNPNADWIPEWRKKYDDVPVQQWSGINEHDFLCQLNRQMNWKAPGIDLLPNYWLKTITTIHPLMTSALDELMKNPDSLPQWVVTGRTTLLPKNSDTHSAKNFRPITCLTTTWKTLTGILATKVEKHLEDLDILAPEQQGARRGSYGTKKQLIINKTILEHAMKFRRNLSITYIDYQKAYDSVPHPWIIETLSTYKVSPIITRFLENAMTMWEIKLILRHDNGVLEVPNVKIKRGISREILYHPSFS